MTVAADSLQLATELGQLLLRKKWTITTAESCTGGGIGYWLTAVPGSSAYVDRGFISYSNKAKQPLLAVRSATLLQFGAVSEQTVREMAEGAAKAANADMAIAVSGIAGPDGGSVYKPVGTVFVTILFQDRAHEYRQQFSGGADAIRQRATEFIYEKLLELLERQQQAAA